MTVSKRVGHSYIGTYKGQVRGKVSGNLWQPWSETPLLLSYITPLMKYKLSNVQKALSSVLFLILYPSHC